MNATLDIREVGPRDGLQIEAPLPTADKFALLDALIATGVRRIEATAFVSPRAVPAMADAAEVAEYITDKRGVHWSALVPNVRGAQRATAAGLSTLEYVVSASDGHSMANVGMPTAAAAAGIAEVAQIAHEAGGTCEVIIAVAWDCPFDGRTALARTVEVSERAIAAGADQICFGDTIGTTVPGRVTQLISAVRDAVGDVPMGAHFHNTRGTGLASAWAAMTAGITMLDSSVGGLGGCPFAPGASGNIATEELVYLAEESGIGTGVDLPKALAAADLAQRIIGHPLESNLLRAGGPARQMSHSTTGVEG